MPEHLRALVVIVGLAAVVFAFAKAPACAMANSIEDFQRRRNLWFAITIATFLAQNFWIYIVVVAAMLLLAVPREVNKLALFFFLMFAVPVIPEQIPGFGIVKYLFTIHYVRLRAMLHSTLRCSCRSTRLPIRCGAACSTASSISSFPTMWQAVP